MGKDPAPKVFVSKIDAWLAALFYFAVGAPVLSGLFYLGTDRDDGVSTFLQMLAVTGGSLLLVVAIVYPTTYTLAEGQIKIRCGWLWRQAVKVSEILEVYPTRNPLSSPALSLDRLGVVVERKGKRRLAVLVSPSDKEAFLSALAKMDGGLVREGKTLVRKS